MAHIARAMHAGADEYIMKPFDKEIMTTKFQEVGLVCSRQRHFLRKPHPSRPLNGGEMSAAPAPALSRLGQPPLRVMIVDDSVVVRGLVSRWLSQHGSMEVIGTAANGRAALDKLDTLDPDAIVLDLDMPELDGIAALPLILRKRPNVSVLVTSTLTASATPRSRSGASRSAPSTTSQSRKAIAT